MNAERHTRISELFLAACGIAPEDREEFLLRECAGDDELRKEVKALLDRDGRPAALDQPVVSGGMLRGLDPAQERERRLPERIGPYEILGLLGEGGMGVVYKARQRQPSRTVALKMIHQAHFSPRGIRRFEFEAEILARLKHAGIAQIFDAGTAEGPYGSHPYFALELVEGVPLTHYARNAALDTKARLGLLARVCDAVHHAHQQGVIHRDLKPANILVEQSGQPKILDFGVARATDYDLTVTTEKGAGQVIGTIPYMSPEQIRGSRDDVDVRSDVYSLGVIAYELLSGSLPYDLRSTNIAEAARIVLEQEIPRLGAAAPECRGEVETVVAKALEKDKERRYPSASDLAADLRRYLSNEPILARPATAFYHLRKLVARHKLPFALTGGLFLMAIVFGVWMSVLYAHAESNRKRAETAESLKAEEAERAHQATDRANREARLAQRVRTFLVDLFENNDPDLAQGQNITVREVLDQGAARVAKELDAEPEVELAMMDVITDVYMKLALFDRAKELAEKSLAIRQRAFGQSHPETAKSLDRLATVAKNESNYEEAIKLIREAVKISNEHLSAGDPATADRLRLLGELQYTTGDLAAGEKSLLKALAMQRAHFGADNEHLIETLDQIVYLRLAQDRLQEGVEAGRELLRVCLKAHGEHHTDTAGAKAALGDMLRRVGQLEEAETVTREALVVLRDLLEPDHPFIAATMNNLALVLKDQKRFDEARTLLEEALALRKSRYGPRHDQIGQALFNLGSLLMQMNKDAEAEPLLAEAVNILEEHFDEDHRHVLLLRYQLGLAIFKQDRYAEAEPIFRRVLEGYERTLPEDHRFIAYTRGLLGGALTQMQRYEDAEPLLVASWDTLRKGNETQRIDRAAERLVELYTAWGKPDLADQYQVIKNGTSRARVDETSNPP